MFLRDVSIRAVDGIRSSSCYKRPQICHFSGKAFGRRLRERSFTVLVEALRSSYQLNLSDHGLENCGDAWLVGMEITWAFVGVSLESLRILTIACREFTSFHIVGEPGYIVHLVVMMTSRRNEIAVGKGASWSMVSRSLGHECFPLFKGLDLAATSIFPLRRIEKTGKTTYTSNPSRYIRASVGTRIDPEMTPSLLI
ncbi:uncharacterized protein BT62DRAFT_1079916 [Guyanagaster necrorhizus]|uniref:Uncharacterized protein n=1 Tax=Guyanagaster necrorhizus TaxID=856835 RepID=A0A9P7VIM6_9AGAR|nr:uncharacterized protein BT62DRAFT_1079916 [Guyanagaster necrorhizus MCA 3950]KAG7441766.1 hypothetical protein BT62DRAFT_1079916 [Guyanagaster necrorhizus MCA 3950]